MRVDIFIRSHLYVSGVTQTNAKNIIAALERSGERVIVCRHNRTGLGKFVYQTPEIVSGPTPAEQEQMGINVLAQAHSDLS
jgi:hypothetical protein